MTARHVSLAEELISEIGSGRHPLGARFPMEQELQERFGVGRHTAREALKILTEQGLVGRRRKTGTIVLSLRPVPHSVHSLRDIRGLLAFAQNTTLEVHHEGFASFTPSHVGDFEAALADPETGRWFRVAGLRSTRRDASPLCWSEILVPERFAPDRGEIRGGGRAIYEIVLAQHGLKLEYVEQTVTGAKLPAPLAQLLRAEVDGAALLVRRRYVAHTGATFEVSHNLYPSDRYAIQSIIRQRA